MKLKCIAVDDEPLALALVTKFIAQTPFLELVGKYPGAIAALEAIHNQQIDLIFADIEMPDLNGIELGRVLDKRPGGPRIIFTTAYNQFALEGYKVDALDYLLKPFNYEEFLRAANKALRYYELIHKPASGGEIRPEPEPESSNYLFLKVDYQLVRIAFDEIVYIESLKDYVKVWKTDGEALLSLTSLKALESKLPGGKFMRLHRSYIIALDKITAMTKSSVHAGKVMIPVGEQYREAFAAFMAKWS